MTELLRGRLIIGPKRQSDVQENDLDQREKQRQHLVEVSAKGPDEHWKGKLNVLVIGAHVPSRFQPDALMSQSHTKAAFKIRIVKNRFEQLGKVMCLNCLERLE